MAYLSNPNPKAQVISGEVAFCNLQEQEVYQGKSTGRYSVVITMDEAEASKLADQGVKIKEYEGRKQRKFASKFHVPIVDTNDQPFGEREIPYGSKVRLLVQTGNPHPVHGTPTYLNKVRVVEEAETSVPAEVAGEF